MGLTGTDVIRSRTNVLRHRFPDHPYFVTTNLTTFETGLPFFGVTVTLNVHVPFRKPFTEEPTTVQTFLEVVDTVTLIFDPAATESPAYFAMDRPVTFLAVVSEGAAILVGSVLIVRGVVEVSVVLMTGDE
jgi:hypothetical protein